MCIKDAPILGCFFMYHVRIDGRHDCAYAKIIGMNKSKYIRRTRAGFTIVELLIVVVVIAILAAITIVGYSGITRSATESALKHDLQTGAKALEIKNIRTGAYPATSIDAELQASHDNTLRYVPMPSQTKYCLEGANGSAIFSIKPGESIKEEACPAGYVTTHIGASTGGGCVHQCRLVGVITPSSFPAGNYNVACFLDGYQISNQGSRYIASGAATSFTCWVNAEPSEGPTTPLVWATLTSGSTTYISEARRWVQP